VVNTHALVATGVNAVGHREILGLQVTSAEDGAGWLVFFRDLTARGLTGVHLINSDAHRGAGRRNRRHLCPARPGRGVARTTPRT
jgi:transposase-like protein